MTASGETDDLLPAGESARQVQLLQQLYRPTKVYRGPTRSVECPDCGGRGGEPIGKPMTLACCSTCGGTGRVSA